MNIEALGELSSTPQASPRTRLICFFVIAFLAVGALLIIFSKSAAAEDEVFFSSQSFFETTNKIPAYTFNIPYSTSPFTVEFYDNNGTNESHKLGTLYFDKDGMRFVGKAKKSARVFFDYLKGNFDKYRSCK